MKNDIKKMEMSHEEILRSYKEAKNKREQVKILAQLNVCPESAIIEVLKMSGIDGRELPRAREKGKEAAQDAAAQVSSSCEVGNGDAVPQKGEDGMIHAVLPGCVDDAVEGIPGVCIHIHANATVYLTVHCHSPAKGAE